jgi:hypothetical protein
VRVVRRMSTLLLRVHRLLHVLLLRVHLLLHVLLLRVRVGRVRVLPRGHLWYRDGTAVTCCERGRLKDEASSCTKGCDSYIPAAAHTGCGPSAPLASCWGASASRGRGRPARPAAACHPAAVRPSGRRPRSAGRHRRILLLPVQPAGRRPARAAGRPQGARWPPCGRPKALGEWGAARVWCLGWYKCLCV